MDRLRRRHEVVAYDGPAAIWHADQGARLDAAGQARPYADGQVAAVAAAAGLVLITRNLKDMHGYQGLQVESWWE